ncbi:unnamed protein product, partial [Vitis vinifera]
MGDAENAVPPSKKRAAGRELSRDNPGLDDEESPEQEGETFKKASNEVMANRRIVKVRRQQTASTPSSNPFAGIRLVPPTEPISAPAEVSTEAQAASEKIQPENSSAEAPPFSSFQQLSSSQNAFTGLAGTGFSSSAFSFGSISKDGSGLGGTPIISKSEGSGFPSLQEVPVETGEENEKAVFTADSVLFEFFDGGWKERGKGELKVNVSRDGVEKARLVMRAKGNYRLILNASLYPDMKLTNMEKRGITFACMNSIGEGKDGLSTFALKFKDASIVEEFSVAVTAHKGKTATVMNTPENSPKASDD